MLHPISEGRRESQAINPGEERTREANFNYVRTAGRRRTDGQTGLDKQEREPEKREKKKR